MPRLGYQINVSAPGIGFPFHGQRRSGSNNQTRAMKAKLPLPPEVESHLFVVRIIHDTIKNKWFATVTKDAIRQSETGYCDTNQDAIKSVILT